MQPGGSALPDAAPGEEPRRAAGGASDFKRLLFINEYPPCTQAGGPVIARQLLRYYDQERLDVLCCGSWYHRLAPQARETLLPCRHTVIPSLRTHLRPRRVFARIDNTVDCLRLPYIMRVGRRIIRERGIEAIFSISYGVEMPHAAYFLAREFNLPFYFFETDRLDAYFTSLPGKYLIKKHRREFLHHAKRLWLTSPAMIREFQRAYGVQGEFLFHFLDLEAVQRIVNAAPPLPRDRIHIVYTGSINAMFYDTMKWFCDWLNRGLTIDGRQVEMTIYSSTVRQELLGPHVRSPGLVKLEEIPGKLAEAHIAGVFVSFTSEEGIKKQIETSLYTKTVDYLAAGRPVLVISPPYSSEVDCYGGATCHVHSLDEAATVAAIRRLVDDAQYREDLRRKGLEQVQRDHSLAALEQKFLRHFRRSA